MKSIDFDKLDDKEKILEIRKLLESQSEQFVNDVGIVIATHNRLSMLLTYIYSALNQKEVHVKIYIVNDNSPDNTDASISTLFNDFPSSIYYEKNSENIGPSESRKKALERVVERYIIFADDDDFYTNENFFHNAIQSIRDNNLVAYFGNSLLFYTQSNKKEEYLLNYKDIKTKELMSSFQIKYKKPSSTFLAIFRFSDELKQNLLAMKMVNDSSIYLAGLLVEGEVRTSGSIDGIYRIHNSNLTDSLKIDFIIQNVLEKVSIISNATYFSDSEKKAIIYEQVIITLDYYFTSSRSSLNDLTYAIKELRKLGVKLKYSKKMKYFVRVVFSKVR